MGWDLSDTDRRRGRVGRAGARASSAVAVGVAGMLFGAGLGTTALAGAAWLHGIDARPAGDPTVTERASGLHSVHNARAGETITVDLTRVRAAGARSIGGESKVLVARGIVVIVDGRSGRLSRVDPVGRGAVGESWRSPAPLADVVADERGTIWALGGDGKLRGLTWDERAGRLAERTSVPIRLVADDGLLAAHPEGVTVFGPRAGVLAQVGTPSNGYRRSKQLVGVVPGTATGPADLVVGTLPSRSAIVILDQGELREVSTAGLGCVRPTNAASFNERVYVVCQGSQKVIRLTRRGEVAGPPIRTPGRVDAEPVVDGRRLMLSVSDPGRGIEVDRSDREPGSDETRPAAPTDRAESGRTRTRAAGPASDRKAAGASAGTESSASARPASEARPAKASAGGRSSEGRNRSGGGRTSDAGARTEPSPSAEPTASAEPTDSTENHRRRSNSAAATDGAQPPADPGDSAARTRVQPARASAPSSAPPADGPGPTAPRPAAPASTRPSSAGTRSAAGTTAPSSAPARDGGSTPLSQATRDRVASAAPKPSAPGRQAPVPRVPDVAEPAIPAGLRDN